VIRRLLVALLLLASPAVAQVLELQGGDSSILNAAGGRLFAYFPNDTVTASVGLLNGHFVYGASVETLFHGWDVKAGDDPLGISIPGAGLYAPIRGVTATRVTKKFIFTVFAGGTGDYFSPGFFQSMQAQHFGTGAFLQRKFDNGANLYALGSVSGSLRTALAGADWKYRSKLRLEGSSGVLESRKFFDGQAVFQPFSWSSFVASQQTYIGVTRVSVDTLGASATLGPISGHATFMDSNLAAGESYGISTHFSIFQVNANRYQSKFGVMNGIAVSEQVRPRLMLTESATLSNGRPTYSGGLMYFSNRFTVSLSPQVYFLPTVTGRSPFQKALSLNITVPLPHGSAFHVLTNVDSQGRLKYTMDASTYEQGPMAGNGGQHYYAGGKYEIHGFVLDDAGKPVEGAAIRVGKELVYSDSAGAWSLRVKRAKSLPIAVQPEEFAAAGTWLCLSCPSSAAPDTDITIVVRRK